MSDLQLDFEWIDAAEAKGPELRATWARLEITLDGKVITRLNDLNSRSVRSSVFLPLYPLAEWLATHWWFLLHEVETLGRSTSDRYDRRHDLRFSAEGFALPSLTIQPFGEQVKLEWRPVRLDAQNIEFTQSGSGYIAGSELRRKLSDFLSAVLRRLHEHGLESTLLEQEWNGIQNADAEELEFCAAVASLGFDPYTLNEAEQQEILNVRCTLPDSVLQDFFAVADLPSLPEQADQILGALERSRKNSVNLESLKLLKREMAYVHPPRGLPWVQGYRFADELRRRLHLSGEKLSSLQELSKALEIPHHDLLKAIVKIGVLPGLDALVDVNSQQSPGFAVAERREEAIRFAFCRALFEYLTTPAGQPLLVTRARSERQKRNRAFAAELLVPADLLRQALPGRVVEDEDIENLAADFGVSPSVIRHQLDNHHLARSLPD